jgi:hypothetical protein
MCIGQRPIRRRLALRELETFSGAGLARFLPLFHPGIPAEQPIGFQGRAEIGVNLQ